jgi:hypothetical protein
LKVNNFIYKIIGLLVPLLSYSKDIAKHDGKVLKQTDSLKRKMGLQDFLSEINDCVKNLLRIMKNESSSNYLFIYVIDFIWKMILIRFEYHLDDEE